MVARLLKEWGWEVEVFLYGDAEKLPPDARVNYERWMELGEVKGEVAANQAMNFGDSDICIDALFGIGLTRPIEQYWREIIDKCDWTERAVAIDIPSGIDADTGEIVDYPDEYLAEAVSYVDPQLISNFDLTVTFHKMKPAHVADASARYCGKVVVKDIGL